MERIWWLLDHREGPLNNSDGSFEGFFFFVESPNYTTNHKFFTFCERYVLIRLTNMTNIDVM